MAKKIIKNGDTVYSTGVFLIRDTTVNGGWVVEGFEDDSFFDGELVNYTKIDDNSVEYSIGDD